MEMSHLNKSTSLNNFFGSFHSRPTFCILQLGQLTSFYNVEVPYILFEINGGINK